MNPIKIGRYMVDQCQPHPVSDGNLSQVSSPLYRRDDAAFMSVFGRAPAK